MNNEKKKKKKIKWYILIIIILIILIFLFKIIFLYKFNNLLDDYEKQSTRKYFMSYNDFIIFDKFQKEEQEEPKKEYVFKLKEQKPQPQNIDLNEVVNEQTLVNKKIAPGVSGEFEIIMDANGATKNMSYNIELFSQNEKPKNLVFNVKGEQIKYNSIEELAETLRGSVEKNTTKKIIIEWSWDYDTKDNYQDTQDGKNIENYTFAVNVIANEII